jgi:hypothetical protein
MVPTSCVHGGMRLVLLSLISPETSGSDDKSSTCTEGLRAGTGGGVVVGGEMETGEEPTTGR